VAVLAVSSLVFALTTFEAMNDAPPSWEISTFSAVNGLPDWLYVVIWPFMQYGVFLTIPIAATAAWWLGRRRLGVLLGISGVTVYVLAKVVKAIVDRGRPDAFLADVVEREAFAPGSIGYTSGHAAVAATIATLTFVQLPTRWRAVTLALVVIVPFGRMYVGAHLPLDLLGGIALGIAAGTAAMLLAGAIGPTRTERSRRVRTFAPTAPQRRPG
jgi:undecaprenyl-diphosphatase